MNLRRAGKGIVRKGKRPSVYRIGFNDGDETELTANGINELEELWRSLCPEFECEPDSVNYVERVGYEEEVMPVLDKLTEIAGQHGTAEKLVSITLSAEGYIHFTVHDSGMCLSRLKREDAPELEIRKQLSQEMGREEN